MENVIDSEIHSIIISDHAPVSVYFSFTISQHKTKQWKINNSLLKDSELIGHIHERTLEFLKNNLNSVPNVQAVGEAFKATCRGWLISYSTVKKKNKQNKKESLIKEIKKVEIQHMSNPSNID